MGSFNPVGIIARMGVISLMGITKSIPLPLRIAFTREVHHSVGGVSAYVTPVR